MTESGAARTDRESMDVDVVIVGAGPAGLSAAIRLQQLAQANDAELMIVVLEKAGAGNFFIKIAFALLGHWLSSSCFVFIKQKNLTSCPSMTG